MDCLICGEGELKSDIDLNVVEYNGKFCILPLHFSRCDTCEMEQGDYTQTKQNAKYMLDFKDRVDKIREVL